MTSTRSLWEHKIILVSRHSLFLARLKIGWLSYLTNLSLILLKHLILFTPQDLERFIRPMDCRGIGNSGTSGEHPNLRDVLTVAHPGVPLGSLSCSPADFCWSDPCGLKSFFLSDLQHERRRTSAIMIKFLLKRVSALTASTQLGLPNWLWTPTRPCLPRICGLQIAQDSTTPFKLFI